MYIKGAHGNYIFGNIKFTLTLKLIAELLVFLAAWLFLYIVKWCITVPLGLGILATKLVEFLSRKRQNKTIRQSFADAFRAIDRIFSSPLFINFYSVLQKISEYKGKKPVSEEELKKRNHKRIINSTAIAFIVTLFFTGHLSTKFTDRNTPIRYYITRILKGSADQMSGQIEKQKDDPVIVSNESSKKEQKKTFKKPSFFSNFSKQSFLSSLVDMWSMFGTLEEDEHVKKILTEKPAESFKKSWQKTDLLIGEAIKKYEQTTRGKTGA